MAHLKNQRILLLRDASRIPRTNFHSQGVRAKVTDLTVDRCLDRFTRNGPALGQIFGDGRELPVGHHLRTQTGPDSPPRHLDIMTEEQRRNDPTP